MEQHPEEIYQEGIIEVGRRSYKSRIQQMEDVKESLSERTSKGKDWTIEERKQLDE